MNRQSLLITLLLLPLAFTAKAQNAGKNDVTMKMQSLRNALLAKDSVTLSSLLADDVTYIHSSGFVQTKSQLIRDVMSGFQDYKSIEPSDMNVRIYDNASVVTVKLKTSVIFGGKPTDLNLLVTLTWIKMNGDWKLVARESVKLPDLQ